MDGYERNIWRRATYDECKKITEYANDALRHKRNATLLNGSCFELVIIMWSVVFGITRVQDKGSNALSGFIFWIVVTAIFVGCCVAYLKMCGKRLKYLEENQFEVTDASVVDRKVIKGRTIESGHYITVKYGDEEKTEKRELRTIESEFDKVELGTRVLLVKYNDDAVIEGFMDEWDVVVM